MTPTSASAVPSQVFVSYSHADHKWLDRLLEHVRPLVRAGHIRVFSDRNIAVGADWRAEIQASLDAAGLAVLLVSVHFLASDFVMTEELPRLLAAAADRGTTIMPVIVTPSLFEAMPSLSRYQAVNPPSRPLCVMRPAQWQQVLSDLAYEIRRHITAQDGGSSAGVCGVVL